MKIFLVLFFIACTAQAQVLQERQFPLPGHFYVPGKDVGFAQYLTKSLRGTKKVVLTFDDGPSTTYTPKVLDILKAYDVKATFFILTERINEKTLPILRRMIAEGHNVASHHLNHINSVTKSQSVYRAELTKSVTSISKLTEEENSLHREIYYRFPYGAYGTKAQAYHHLNVMKQVSSELFGDNCINFTFWDIDTADWLAAMTSSDIAQNVLAHVVGGTAYDFELKNGKYNKIKYSISKPIGGGVVLLHDIHERSVNAVPLFLEQFRQKHIEVVPLQEVKEYAYNGKECRLKI